MAKGPIITHRVELLIASVYDKHPKWKAPEIRNEVSFHLHKENPKLPSGWPSLSTVQKLLAIARKTRKELPIDPQDKPWSTATLDQYPIPPEALPAVLKVLRYNIEKGKGVTIREAKWVSRLSAIKQAINQLSTVASFFAETEQLDELIGRPFDSTLLDKLLMNLPPGGTPFTDYLAARGIEVGVEEIRDNIKETEPRGGTK